jgi:hypothetical protein
MLENLKQPSGEMVCQMMSKATELDKADLKIFLTALDNPHWNATQLALELTGLGFSVGRDAILKHRKKQCRCAK